jgi:hypothetical protein
VSETVRGPGEITKSPCSLSLSLFFFVFAGGSSLAAMTRGRGLELLLSFLRLFPVWLLGALWMAGRGPSSHYQPPPPSQSIRRESSGKTCSFHQNPLNLGALIVCVCECSPGGWQGVPLRSRRETAGREGLRLKM